MGQKWLQACARASGPKTTKIASHGLYSDIGLSHGYVGLGNVGPVGFSIALSARAVPTRAELVCSLHSTRTGALEQADFQPRMLGKGSDHGVGLGVGCDGRTLWLVVGSLSERQGRAAAANRASIKYTIYKTAS